jgi:membrane-associated protein
LNISDQLLAALTLYGLPVLFGATFINSIGVPIPDAFLLIAAGSYVHLGDMNLWGVIVLATIGAVLGDQVGYGIGFWGGRRLAHRLSKWLGGEKRWHDAEGLAKKWGGPGIFLSRWLFTALNSWVNVISGITTYSYPKFLFWDISGEIVWVILYVLLGNIFSDRVQELIEALANLIWVEIGILAALLFGWRLIVYFRSPNK